MKKSSASRFLLALTTTTVPTVATFKADYDDITESTSDVSSHPMAQRRTTLVPQMLVSNPGRGASEGLRVAVDHQEEPMKVPIAIYSPLAEFVCQAIDHCSPDGSPQPMSTVVRTMPIPIDCRDHQALWECTNSHTASGRIVTRRPIDSCPAYQRYLHGVAENLAGEDWIALYTGSNARGLGQVARVATSSDGGNYAGGLHVDRRMYGLDFEWRSAQVHEYAINAFSDYLHRESAVYVPLWTGTSYDYSRWIAISQNTPHHRLVVQSSRLNHELRGEFMELMVGPNSTGWTDILQKYVDIEIGDMYMMYVLKRLAIDAPWDHILKRSFKQVMNSWYCLTPEPHNNLVFLTNAKYNCRGGVELRVGGEILPLITTSLGMTFAATTECLQQFDLKEFVPSPDRVLLFSADVPHFSRPYEDDAPREGRQSFDTIWFLFNRSLFIEAWEDIKGGIRAHAAAPLSPFSH